MTHRCQAAGCRKSVPLRMLMCFHHWRLVPAVLQREVWRTYVPGQEVTMNITDDYLMAVSNAINAVADREAAIARAKRDNQEGLDLE